MSKKKSLSVSLVLGSGGARGLAHIGIIQLLCERGYPHSRANRTSASSTDTSGKQPNRSSGYTDCGNGSY